MPRHSVRRHLRLEIEAYDETIRRFVPGYERCWRPPPGWSPAGTRNGCWTSAPEPGPLAEAILLRSPEATVELLDVDVEMLEQAGERLVRFGDRAPPAAGPSSSRCRSAMRCGPRSRSTMCRRWTRRRRSSPASTMRSGPAGSSSTRTSPCRPIRRRRTPATALADHLVSCGIPEERAFRHFEEWLEEDTYFPREVEYEAMRRRRFEVRWVWSRGPMVVAAGSKTGERPSAD